MRRLSDRARLEGMLALRKALDGVRRGSAVAQAAGDDVTPAPDRNRRIEESAWSRRAEFAPDDAIEPLVAPLVLNDPELTKALDRIVDSIDRIGAQLDSYHLERAEHLDAIEFLLREMVIGTVPATGSRSIVFGGVVDGSDRDQHDDEIMVLPDGFPLVADTPVEVRSRFHDRWIAGFNIAESVDTPGRFRYRLTRRSDGIPLPILFDACDVRAVSNSGSYERKNAPSSRSSMNESRSVS